MYTPKRKQQKKRRKTQKQHCFIDEALSINYPFPNKIFNFPKCVKVPALRAELSLCASSMRKAMKGGSTNLEIGLASWFNYIIGLKDLVIEQIIETYKNTLPIPVIGEIVKIVSEYFSLMSIPILWLVGLISNAFTSLVGTVKTNWHYVLILITSLDLIEWAGTAVNASGVPIFDPATTVASFLNNTLLNFGAVVNFVWAIVATIWTIVVYWIPSNLFMFIFSNSLFSFSIVIYIFVVLMMWISEHLNPSYYIRMMDAKQTMNDIHKRLKDISKNIPAGEFMNKEKKLEEELKKAKELYREAKKQYEEDLKKNHPEEYTVYNLKKLKDDMEKAENENKESESAVKKATKSNIGKAKKQAEKTTQKYQAAKEAYDTAKEAYDAEMANKTHSSSSSTTSGGNRNTRKQKQKEVDYESVVHRLFSKKSLANFKNLSTAELEEIRKKQPFPFEIALALGFIKKTEDGYELVEKRIQKLKEPVIQSISFLNHRCKGCKPKTHRTTQKGGSIDTPLEDYELDSLREALTGVKMLHTASIYAITREAVEMEEKHKMTGGGDQDPDPFLNIPQTLNQLKSADMDWLLKKSPEEFEIAEKWGIVVNGELSHSAREILQDTAEMSKSIVKKRIPKASQRVLFPSQMG